MIESQTSTAIVEDKLPAYADEPDAPLEKDLLLPAEALADVEVTLIKNVPVTSKIRTTIGHLHRVGGFSARWRGAGASMLYHGVHGAASHVIASFFGRGPLLHAIVYTFVSVATSRLHMLWTHTMIAAPTTKPIWRRFVSRKDARPILLPSLVFALAQQATILFPFAVAFVLGVPEMDHAMFAQAAEAKDHFKIACMVLRIAAVPATALLVALAVLLPAAVTLTRIEALLLPADQDTIVPFDRQAITAGVDTTKRCQAFGLFTSAWRSFDRASRWRLIKLYVKLIFIQIAIVFIGVHVMLAELWFIGGERIAIFFKSAAAQLQLMAIEDAQ